MAGKKGCSGRPRKPQELHALEGTGRSDRGTNKPIKLADSNETVSRTPAEWLLSEEPLDKAEFYDEIQRWCQRLGIDYETDRHLLSMIVAEYSIYVDLYHRIQKEGVDATYTSKNVSCVSGLRATAGALKSLLSEIGATPSGRASVVALGKDVKVEDPLGALLNTKL